jgi:uncharacterized membrane protein YcaP (DUF421 family)
MNTIVHSIIGYFYLLLTIRVLSRRPGAQMTMSEFVIVFLMGGIIILATMGEDRSLTNSVSAVLTVALLHRTVAYSKLRWPRLGVIIDGTPLLVLKDGQWQTDIMRRVRIHDDDVMAAARAKGLKTLDQIKYAVLERNGAISIITAGAK